VDLFISIQYPYTVNMIADNFVAYCSDFVKYTGRGMPVRWQKLQWKLFNLILTFPTSCNIRPNYLVQNIPLIVLVINKGNNKITEHRAIFQRESKNSQLINQQTDKISQQPENWETAMALTWYRPF